MTEKPGTNLRPARSSSCDLPEADIYDERKKQEVCSGNFFFLAPAPPPYIARLATCHLGPPLDTLFDTFLAFPFPPVQEFTYHYTEKETQRDEDFLVVIEVKIFHYVAQKRQLSPSPCPWHFIIICDYLTCLGGELLLETRGKKQQKMKIFPD